MKVELLDNSILYTTAFAIRTCWNSFDKSDNGGDKDKALIERVGNKNKHKSILEHLHYTFYIKDISRACLQELVRHRMASYSVKSTRYTLKELKDEHSFLGKYNFANKYLVFTGNDNVDKASIEALENLRIILQKGVSNDIAKYCLPEAYKTELTMTINARSLQNFFELRNSKNALWEIQDLAKAIYQALPDTHKYLFIKDNE